jgi:outer membrane protein OmpA-like peptidoglycan-associated protein
MNTFSRFLAALALITAVTASAQNWTKSYPYAHWNSTGNDFMHAPSLVPGDVLFVSDRPNVDHGKIAVKRCGKFKKPYSVFRGHGTTSTQITDAGTERWAGVPVYSPTADFMAVPQWNAECNQGVAGIELLVYKAVNEASDLAFDGKNWKLVEKATQPEYTTAHQPHFAHNAPTLVFAAERPGGNSDLFTMDLTSPDYVVAPFSSEVNTSVDEVYPTYWGDTLLFSRSTPSGLDVFSWDGTKSFALPEITNSNAHDFNLWVHSLDSAWINTRRDANHSDLWVLVGKKTAKAVEIVKKPVEPAPVLEAAPMDEIIYAGKFNNPKNAERRAAALATNPALIGLVSVQFDGTSYVIVVTPPKGNAATTHAIVQKVAADAVIAKIPGRNKAFELEIYFDFDKHAIRPGEAKRIREFLAQINARQGSFELVGHCDSRGTNFYNLTLGLNRSKSVKRFIEQELGSRITSLEFSRSEWDLQEPCPDGVNCPDAKHERNRRVMVRFTY